MSKTKYRGEYLNKYAKYPIRLGKPRRIGFCHSYLSAIRISSLAFDRYSYFTLVFDSLSYRNFILDVFVKFLCRKMVSFYICKLKKIFLLKNK